MSIIELLPEPIFNRISSSFEKNESGNGKFAELLNDRAETSRGENERAQQPIEKQDKVDEFAFDDYETSTAKDDHSDFEHEADRDDHHEDDDRPSNAGQHQSDDDHAQSVEKPVDVTAALAGPENVENSTPATPATPITPTANDGKQIPEAVGKTVSPTLVGLMPVETAQTGNGLNGSRAAVAMVANSGNQSVLERAAQVQKQEIPVGLERALNIQGQLSQMTANAGIDRPANPTVNVEVQPSVIAKATPQAAAQKNAAAVPQQPVAHANVNPEADNLPALRNHTAIAQLLQQDKPVEISSLIQYFQAKMGQSAGSNSVDTGNPNPAGQSNSSLVDTLKSMMTQSSSGGQLGSHGYNSQNGLPLGAAISGLASSQNNPTGNAQANFASSLGVDGVGVGGQANSLQVQQAAQVANMPAPKHAATNMQSPTVQIGFQITKAVDQGINRMSIRLDPAELGRVRIQLEVGGDGRVQAMIMADKQDTLDLLQRDAKMLEKVLKDAGLETSSEDLSFSLQQGNQNQWASGRSDNFGQSNPDLESSDDVPLASNEHGQPDIISDRALDVRV